MISATEFNTASKLCMSKISYSDALNTLHALRDSFRRIADADDDAVHYPIEARQASLALGFINQLLACDNYTSQAGILFCTASMQAPVSSIEVASSKYAYEMRLPAIAAITNILRQERDSSKDSGTRPNIEYFVDGSEAEILDRSILILESMEGHIKHMLAKFQKWDEMGHLNPEHDPEPSLTW